MKTLLTRSISRTGILWRRWRGLQEMQLGRQQRPTHPPFHVRARFSNFTSNTTRSCSVTDVLPNTTRKFEEEETSKGRLVPPLCLLRGDLLRTVVKYYPFLIILLRLTQGRSSVTADFNRSAQARNPNNSSLCIPTHLNHNIQNMDGMNES